MALEQVPANAAGTFVFARGRAEFVLPTN